MWQLPLKQIFLPDFDGYCSKSCIYNSNFRLRAMFFRNIGMDVELKKHCGLETDWWSKLYFLYRFLMSMEMFFWHGTIQILLRSSVISFEKKKKDISNSLSECFFFFYLMGKGEDSKVIFLGFWSDFQSHTLSPRVWFSDHQEWRQHHCV